MNRHQRNKLKAAIHSERLMIWIICENWDMEDDVRLRERSLRIQRNNKIAKARRRLSRLKSGLRHDRYNDRLSRLKRQMSECYSDWFEKQSASVARRFVFS